MAVVHQPWTTITKFDNGYKINDLPFEIELLDLLHFRSPDGDR